MNINSDIEDWNLDEYNTLEYDDDMFKLKNHLTNAYITILQCLNGNNMIVVLENMREMMCKMKWDADRKDIVYMLDSTTQQYIPILTFDPPKTI